jgi:hypothetical protein
MRGLKGTLLLIACAVSPCVGYAESFETTHIFGFTIGTDVNQVGENEGEFESTGRFGKSAGTYSVLSNALGLKFIPFENFSIEPGVSIAYHNIARVPDLEDRNGWSFEAVSLELRYRVLDRAKAPVGLTLGIDPRFGTNDEISGAPADRYGSDFILAIDQELVATRFFAAFNFIYGLEATRSHDTSAWEHQSGFAFAAAATAQIYPGVLLGGEVRYLRAYGGMSLDRFAGQAAFIGPTFYAKFSERLWISAAWNIQVAGSAAAQAGPRDLSNFERHQAKLRFGYNF